MKAQDHIELVIDMDWFKQFPWSLQLINPERGLSPESPAVPIDGELIDPGHPSGVIIKTSHTWDAKRQEHPGIELFVPWRYVVAILKVENEERAAERRAGFMPP